MKNTVQRPLLMKMFVTNHFLVSKPNGVCTADKDNATCYLRL